MLSGKSSSSDRCLCMKDVWLTSSSWLFSERVSCLDGVLRVISEVVLHSGVEGSFQRGLPPSSVMLLMKWSGVVVQMMRWRDCQVVLWRGGKIQVLGGGWVCRMMVFKGSSDGMMVSVNKWGMREMWGVSVDEMMASMNDWGLMRSKC